MNREEYTQRVLDALGRLTPKEISAVRTEIEGHIEDHMESLLELGYDEKLAEERTMAAMGDPEEVGRELNKQYPLFWLVVSRVITAVMVLVILTGLLSGSTLVHRAAKNIEARTSPVGNISGHSEERCYQELDIRLEIGSDMLYFFGTAIDQQDYVRVYWVKYDQSIFGLAGDWDVTYENEAGEDLLVGGGTSTGSGVSYHRDRLYDTIPEGTPFVTAVVDRYGERHEVQIPLKWEEEGA